MKDTLPKDSVCFIHDDSNAEKPIRMLYAQGAEYNITNADVSIQYDTDSGILSYTINGTKQDIVNIESLIEQHIVELPIASNTTLGGIKTNYTASASNVPVKVTSEGSAYVTIPGYEGVDKFTEFKYSKTTSNTSKPSINKTNRNNISKRRRK